MNGGWRKSVALALILTGAGLRAASDAVVQMGDKLA